MVDQTISSVRAREPSDGLQKGWDGNSDLVSESGFGWEYLLCGHFQFLNRQVLQLHCRLWALEINLCKSTDITSPCSNLAGKTLFILIPSGIISTISPTVHLKIAKNKKKITEKVSSEEKYVFKLFLFAILCNSLLVSCRYWCCSILASPFPKTGLLIWGGDKWAVMRASFLGSPRTREWTRWMPKSAAWSEIL